MEAKEPGESSAQDRWVNSSSGNGDGTDMDGLGVPSRWLLFLCEVDEIFLGWEEETEGLKIVDKVCKIL